jgi:levanase/fructan beta-fructosidase
LNVRLAVNKIDYYVPFDLMRFQDKNVLLDIKSKANARNEAPLKNYVCWKSLEFADSFSLANKEKYRPAIHHTPAYGWMNDPNGMFYRDGVWNLYFQHNPYGSQWENMTWGHSTSKDLIHWNNEGDAVYPDALGTVFSGSAVIDSNNTAGFGRGAIVAMYTSAKENQTQSIAYSTDGGKTFSKYTGNPVLTSDVPDFRDPKMFWNEDIKAWNLILAAGQEMRIYSSNNLLDWHYESSFGSGYGSHDGVWECPDLMKIHSEDGDKWVLICNINPGGPAGGSATQYFIGTFDGHTFVCQNPAKGESPLWMDYGKDHYATVTFSNAPQGRHVAMAWMSNWQYSNQVPTMQYRSANSLPRDLSLYNYSGKTYLACKPSKEVDAARGKKVSKLQDVCEILVKIKSQTRPTTISLSNKKGEEVVMSYNPKQGKFSMNRSNSGIVSFSEEFKTQTVAPAYGEIKELRIFIDKCSIEAFDSDGKMVMTNLVFPTEPYSILRIDGKASASIYQVK